MSLETAEIKGLDVQDALRRLRGNVKLYTKLIGRFVDGSETQALRVSLDAGDLETAIRDAHTIKGAAANLSAEDIRAKALELETALKSGESVDESHKALFAEILALYANLKEQVTPHLQ
ncbi:hypothetical protein FACS1894217_00250 [Clostridia bacterium]|nr:hypothetical protein FACS1894217_00250 [Clostridia bacterium]